MRQRYAFAGLAAAAAIGVTALAGPVAATAASDATAAPGRCGTRVFLDGIRALEISERGHDEVQIRNAQGRKIWPVTSGDVSMRRDQRVEVDKCVKPGVRLTLWEIDAPPFDGNDRLGTIRVTNATRNYEFRTGESRYRIGVLR